MRVYRGRAIIPERAGAVKAARDPADIIQLVSQHVYAGRQAAILLAVELLLFGLRFIGRRVRAGGRSGSGYAEIAYALPREYFGTVSYSF